MKKISFARFNKLIEAADFIEIGDDKATEWTYGDSDRNPVITTEIDEGLICESVFDSSKFPAEVTLDGAVSVEDQNGNECEIHFYKGKLIKP